MKKHYRVVIPPSAKESLHDIIEHIKKDSPTAATKVRKKLIDTAKSLKELHERF
jgi:plasmid stabilization system protein ParE